MEAGEGRDFQRLDLWLWCARLAKTRAECARQVAGGSVRINRLPTDKPHAKLRVGDVLTLALGGRVRVWRVLALAERRGPASEARGLYEDLSDPA
jgi:ribosome-associated heat shock protein Hsp15